MEERGKVACFGILIVGAYVTDHNNF